jgi:hypothetical protein
MSILFSVFLLLWVAPQTPQPDAEQARIWGEENARNRSTVMMHSD